MADRDEQDLIDLSEDYPDWVFQHMPEASPAWEARRETSTLPATGGHMWIGAATARDLMGLLDAALTAEARIATGPAARTHLEALRLRAAGAGWRADLDWRVLMLIAPGTTGTVVVTCGPRVDDDDKFWFFDGAGLPIVEADNVVDALVVLGGRAVTRGE
ncbi:hypothetical protein [Actinomadura sp. NPDC049753]|uniref:hypothetical protein n=1 Tax=Actinomadura sp. NPDC049753 TaxID=3154739 RepID=UPI003445BC54